MRPEESHGALDAIDDAELVQQIAGQPPGEANEAEGELYRRLAPRVRLYGLRHLRDEQSAADLTQQVLMIALEGLRAGRLREPEKLASFVLGTCRMVVLDLRRGTQRRGKLMEEYARDLPRHSSPEIPEADSTRLVECMAKLPERERSVVVLTFFDERTSEELTGFLGVSAGNLRVIRHRALGRLRNCLAVEGGVS